MKDFRVRCWQLVDGAPQKLNLTIKYRRGYQINAYPVVYRKNVSEIFIIKSTKLTIYLLTPNKITILSQKGCLANTKCSINGN